MLLRSLLPKPLLLLESLSGDAAIKGAVADSPGMSRERGAATFPAADEGGGGGGRRRGGAGSMLVAEGELTVEGFADGGRLLFELL